MSQGLRILPLVAVAIGGVIATKAISGAVSLPELLSATRAAAEEAPAKGRKPLNLAAAQSPLQSMAAPAPPPKPAPICAPSLAELAKEASLSPAELTTLQSLQQRRGQLDQREKDIDTQRQLLAAAELKLDAKLRALNLLRDQMKGMLAQADQQKQAEVDRLVKVYEKMKPRDAGAVMATLDESVRLPVASRMREASLAAILSQMGTLEAKKLTESMAQRFAPNAKLAQAMTPPPAPAAAPPPAAAADPLAQSGDDATVDEPPPAKPKPAPKPRAAKPAPKAVAKRTPPPAPKAAAPPPAPEQAAKAEPPPAASPPEAVASAGPPPASPGQVAAAGDTRAR